MSPVYYLFEPAAMKLLGCVSGDGPQILRAVLFEDYFLPQICGRNTNYNKNDWTYTGNLFEPSDIESRWILNRRSKAVAFIENENPLYCIKNPELQPILEDIKETFPGCEVLNIIRDGFEVIGSSIERGWYTDDYMNSAIIDYVEEFNGVNVPFYISEEDRELWPGYNQATRCALIWRVLIEYGFEHGATNIFYEQFCENPWPVINNIESKYKVKATDITNSHIESIVSWKPEKNPVVTEKDIMEPERSRFLSLMYELGYDEN
jgi:hypothetical protein